MPRGTGVAPMPDGLDVEDDLDVEELTTPRAAATAFGDVLSDKCERARGLHNPNAGAGSWVYKRV